MRGHAEDLGRDEVDLDLAEEPEAVGLGVDGPAVVEVPRERDVDPLVAASHLLEEGVLVEEFLRGCSCLPSPALTKAGLALPVESA